MTYYYKDLSENKKIRNYSVVSLMIMREFDVDAMSVDN